MWETIKDFPDYEITRQGDIRRKDNKITFSKVYDKDGYVKTALRKDGKRHYLRVHRLVAEQFIPKEGGKEIVNHINGVKDDNRVENLEWVTHRENVIHGFEVLGRVGNNGGMNKPVEKICTKTGKTLKKYNSVTEALKELEAKGNSITHVLNGRSKTAYGYYWREVEKV